MSDAGDSRKIWEKLVINTERSPEEVMEFYVEWAKTVITETRSSFESIVYMVGQALHLMAYSVSRCSTKAFG